MANVLIYNKGIRTYILEGDVTVKAGGHAKIDTDLARTLIVKYKELSLVGSDIKGDKVELELATKLAELASAEAKIATIETKIKAEADKEAKLKATELLLKDAIHTLDKANEKIEVLETKAKEPKAKEAK